MNKHTTDIVAYLSWPGLLIAFLLGDRYNSRFHLNQSLVIWFAMTILGVATKIISFVGDWLPLIGWSVHLAGGILGAVCWIFCAVCWFISFINAIQGVEKEVPVLGQIHIL